MEETTLTWSIPNFITVALMGLVAYFAINFAMNLAARAGSSDA